MTTDTSWYGQQTLVHPEYPQYTEYAQVSDYAAYGYQQQPQYQGHGYDHQHQQYYAQPVYGVYEQPVHQVYEQPVPVPDYYEYYEPQVGFAVGTGPEPEPELEAELAHEPDPEPGYAYDAPEYESEAAYEPEPEAEYAPEPAVGGRAAARGSRRRQVRRRSAVLTIAVPSVAVLGVAGAAAATIGPLRPHQSSTTVSASADASAQAKALAAAEAKDAAERASRDQQRTALALRNAAAKKAAAEAPVFTLPIAYHSGLSALFGQAGTHWMQLHTGIDFPVPVGTPVHAVTGGTISTEWNPFYGYMVKLTAPDGTITWYCHLSSYRVRSGQVKVGDIIAYSGDTGNSTGPHMHFEVHPNGGPAVDPLPWLLARGLDPR
ncbi:M23 family metallopeptidase [Streptacidiphilus rugosus]|uniref:M23 family metallopeptidase n=1 Tax=Streptacidiphilus rugosus TaxID=405783 RepID=UPI000690240A|nr:M23 family metallopeptidase [Streptacidiphilus rugosus]